MVPDFHSQVVVITPDRYLHCKPIEPFFKRSFIYTDEMNWCDIEKYNPSVLIFLADWTSEHVGLIENAKAHFVPTILLMDGLIDWKGFLGSDKWFAGNNILPYHPIFCDKVFVPGFRTARTLMSWGNPLSKIEVTGLPRFDTYKTIRNLWKQKIQSNKKRVLILSSNTPGHTEEQIKLSQQLFFDLHNELAKLPNIEVVWRVRKSFDKLIPASIQNSTSGELKDYLVTADIVISQPSSVVAEAMYVGAAVAIADYGVFPDYYQSAWRISSCEQIRSVVQDMVSQSPEKILFQNEIIADLLSNVGVASESCAYTIIQLVEEAEKIKIDHQSIGYTSRISEGYLNASVEKMNPLYFSETGVDFEGLPTSLLKIKMLEGEIKKLKTQLSRRGLEYWFGRFLRKVKNLMR